MTGQKQNSRQSFLVLRLSRHWLHSQKVLRVLVDSRLFTYLRKVMTEITERPERSKFVLFYCFHQIT